MACRDNGFKLPEAPRVTAAWGIHLDAPFMKAWIFLLALISGGAAGAAERPTRDAKAVEEAVALQVFLDRANFGPGKIDGHYGDFTKKALDRYRQARGDGSSTTPAKEVASSGANPSTVAPATSGKSRSSEGERQGTSPTASAELPEPSPLVSSERQPSTATREKRQKADQHEHEQKQKKVELKVDASDLDLASVSPVFVDYKVTDADAQAVGELPGTPAAKAKLKELPYASVAEAVAERFHMDVDFLEELNPGKTKGLRAGDVVRVPNVEPFELNSVKDIKPGEAISGKGANAVDPSDESTDDGKDKGETKGGEKDRAKKKDEKPEKSAPSKLSVVITKDENMLEVMDDGKMIAAFPVTVGSEETASPLGEWKVRGVAKMPEFRYDEKMLKEGERSGNFHLLPPGPNNPVGVVWIALNKKGVGIHGSDSPDAIGRNVSHGCIRLANWDIVKLTSMVKAGVPVTIR